LPIQYEIADGIIVVTMSGQVTSAEFAGYLTATSTDPQYRSDLPRLVILSDDVAFPPSREIIQYASKTPERMLGPDIRFACVARTPLAVGIASMFMGHAGLGNNYQVFDNESAAREWLLHVTP
jgi:hypothetical protein